MPKIELADCKPGHLYRLEAHNIRIGVWNPYIHLRGGKKGSFVGIRTKFGNRFLDHELHYDAHEHYGTATPTEELAVCPHGIIDPYDLESANYDRYFQWLDEMEKEHIK